MMSITLINPEEINGLEVYFMTKVFVYNPRAGRTDLQIISLVVSKAISTMFSSWSEAARWNTLKMFFQPDLTLQAWELTI